MKKTIKVMCLLLFLILIYIAYTMISIWNYGNVDEKRQADVAIILGAAAFNGEVSPVFQERIHHGVWLYQHGYVKKLILTGGVAAGNDVSDAYTAMQYAISLGALQEDILLEERSTITQENIMYAKEIMEEYSYESAIVVSDPLHMKRAMLMAKDYGMQAYSSPTPTTRYVTLKTKLPFLGRECFYYIGYQLYRLFT